LRSRGRWSACASTAAPAGATDPAQPYGGVLPWPRVEHEGRRPARVPGAHVVFLAGVPALYVERGGRGLSTLLAGPVAQERMHAALAALAEAVQAGRVGRLSLERIDAEQAIGSKWETLFAEFGFRAGPRRLTLSA
jgi:ATP-dependent Lhr-like helicase